MAHLEIHYDSEDTGGSGEWAALYVDGKLDQVGDAYLAEERAFELAGVTIVHDSAFLRGGDGMDRGDGKTVAATLDEVAAYRQQRDANLAEARRLQEQAAQLQAQANMLQRGSRRDRQ